MAETLTVALRVAEEAIEEAIAKAEEFSDSLVRHPLLLLFFLSLTLSLSLSPLHFSFCSSLPSFRSMLSLSCLSPLLLPHSWSQYQQEAVMVFG